MTNHAAEPAVRHHANDAPPPFQQGPDASRPVREASLIAGVALLLMAALAGFGYNVAIHRLITPGNATRTAQDIMAHQGLFRAGIASLFLVIALDVVAALGLSDINRFTDIWHAGLILFGLYLLMIAWLAYRSGYVPKLLGILIAIAGLGYIYDSIGTLVSHGSWTQVSTVTFIGEFLLALWLVTRGRRITVSQPALRAEPAGAAR